MNGITRTVVFAALTLLSFGAWSEPIDTVEWLASRADVIVTGTIQDVQTVMDPPRYFGDKAIIRVTRTLKGEPREQIGTYCQGKQQYSLRAYQVEGGEYLFFLLRGINIPRENKDPKAWDILMLDRPDINVISLDRLTAQPLFSCTFQTLDNPAQIIAAVQNECRQPVAVRAQLVVPPPNSPAGLLLTNLSDSLRIPDEDQWKRPFLEFYIQTPRWVDFDFPFGQDLKCPQTLDLLKSLLQDPSWAKRRTQGWNRSIVCFEKRYYYNRQAAFTLLKEWNQAPATRPVTEEPLVPRRLFPRGLFFLPLALVPLLCFPRRRSFLNCLLNCATAGSFVLSCLAVFFYVRSIHHYDDLIFATPSAEYEISSFRGRLRVLFVADQPEPHPPVFGSVVLGKLEDVPDHIDYLYPSGRGSFVQIEFMTGLTPPANGGNFPPTVSNAFEYRLVRIPYAILIVATTLVPALRGLSLIRRRSVIRRRRKNNRCLACGYDLRASPDRCPECGHEPQNKHI